MARASSKDAYHDRPHKPRGPWKATEMTHLIREACRRDFWTFFLYAFGAGLNPKGKHWIDRSVHKPMAMWFQKHIDEWLEWRKNHIKRQKHLAILVHREIGKTTLFTRAGQLWLHLRDPDIATATGAEKEGLAQNMLEAMKAVLDGSDEHALWTKLFGDWATSARKWTGKAIVHAGRRNTSRQDPSMVIFGVETSITGSHPDAIFYDDPISYERLTTDTNWLQAVNSQVSSLIPVIQGDGLVVWVGTRYDAEDHFGVGFRNQGVASVDGMQTDSLPTITEDGGMHVYFMAARDGQGNPTTPLVWPDNRLKSYQKTDPLRYAAQVMNDPSISELNPITREQIMQCGVDKKDVPWSALRFSIQCDTAFADDKATSNKDETVMIVHGHARNGSGDVYVVEGHGNARMRAEDFGKLLVSTVQRYRRQGFHIIAITDERTRAGKADSWRLALANFFADVNEPMPQFIEFERGNTKKYERLHNATTFWVDGHVRWIKGAPGVDRLCAQMANIGQYAVNPRTKIDWADAHSDAFQPDIYRPMRRMQHQADPWSRGAQPIAVEGLNPGDFDDDWRTMLPREPIR